jgi:glycerophosphoryl diester phosphodiesterase
MVLDELLAAAGRDTELMLDLKGHDPRLPEQLLAAIRSSGRCGRITVCSQEWRLLEPFATHPEIRVVHSVGNARQFARLRQRDRALAGVSIHERLLDAAVVDELRRRAALVLSWPVESVAQARRLAGWGVHGLISRSFENLAAELG